MRYAKLIGAAIAGIFAGGISVALLESVSHTLYPVPSNIDINNHEQLSAWVMGLPLAAFLIVLLSWSVGAYVGPFLSRLISPGRAIGPAVVVWLLFGIAVLANLVSIPHPWWMWPSGIGVWIVCGLLGLALSAPKSTEIFIVRNIDSPMGKVFQTIANPNQFAAAIPDIVRIEIISDTKTGVGTRFRETRKMNGKEAVAEMEITEFVENQRVRLAADMAGTDWDSRFELAQQETNVRLELHLLAKSRTLLSRLATPLMMNMISKAIEGDMDHVKAHCERPV